MFLVLFASFKHLFHLYYSIIISVIVVLVVMLSFAFLKSAEKTPKLTLSPGL